MSRQKAIPVLFETVKHLIEVEGGAFRVASDGKVYRKRRDGRYELTPQTPTGRKGNNYTSYYTVSITRNGKQKNYYVHRLVATAYVPNPDNKPEINHIDGNGQNNHYTNLEWVTPKENMQHAFNNGLIPSKATHGIPCKYCRDLTLNDDLICYECKAQIRLNDHKLIKKNQLGKEIYSKLQDINVANIKQRDKDILVMRAGGHTLNKIGNVFGITRQRVAQIIDEVLPRE